MQAVACSRHFVRLRFSRRREQALALRFSLIHTAKATFGSSFLFLWLVLKDFSSLLLSIPLIFGCTISLNHWLNAKESFWKVLTNDDTSCYNVCIQSGYAKIQSWFFLKIKLAFSHNETKQKARSFMRRLYFKKLISILGHTLLCIVIYCIGFTLLTLIANFFKNHFVRLCIGFGIPLILVLIRVFHRRSENQEMRRAYLADANRERLVWREEWHRLLKFPDFRAEVLAFASIAFIFAIIVAFIVTGPWWIYILVALIYLLAPCTLYFIIDFILWVIVHNSWRKDA